MATAATPMETSRIFVKGLPPKITDADFRKHFSAGGREVTDVKVIPQRRIGYVGYKTPEVATKAVKYFNRSYIRMSRINVELARPIADPALQKTKGGSGLSSVTRTSDSAAPPPPQSVEKDDSSAKKRKREELDESDPKLREFLQVMQPGKHSSANEMLDIMDPAAVEEQKKLLQDGESDDEYEAIPARPEKRQMREVPKGDQRPAEPLPEKDEAMPDAAPVPEPTPDATQEEAPAAAANNKTATSDDDWLRSRTNRLLDLVDDDEVLQPPAQQDIGETTGSAPADNHEEPAEGPEKPKADTETGAGADNAPAPSEKKAEEEDDTLATIKRTSRLFVRNLAYSVNEEDLRAHFEQFGELQEVHLPVTAAGASKGYAMVLFTNADSAVAAFQSSDGQTFQGRLLHVLPAAEKRDAGLDEFAISKLPLKKQNLIRKKAEAASSTFNWNSLYMSQDAVNASVASRLGVSKSELLDPTSADAGVKQAIAETSIIQETKAYFASNGVDLDAFKSQKRGDTTILVKNFPFGTTMEELRTMFEEHGTVLRVLMPPSGTIAIVEFVQPTHAKAAFAKLAYRRIKDTVLFLEKGPKDLFKNDASVNMPQGKEDRPTGVQKLSVTELLGRDEQGEADVETTSLFVRNLNFSTTTAKLAETFKPLDGFVSARVKTKLDPKKPGQVLSMGFGFVVFKTKEQAQAALKSMDGLVLEGHKLAVKASHKGQDAAEERRREDKARKAAGQRTKVVIKNLPFEATKKDIRTLFGTYGQLRAVRLPKKFGNSTRGFAFAEFVTPRPWDLARQRWLDSGFIMGTVKDVRRVFETAKHKIDLCVRKGNLGMDAENGDAGALCYSGSYQSVFVEMMGQQEFHREVMRRHHRTAFERALDWIFPQRFDGSAPPVSVIENEIIDDPLTPSFGNGGWKPEYRPNKPLELGITLDYFSSVAHQTADALHNTAYIVHSQPLEPQLPSEPTDCESAQAPWPADLVPHDTLLLLFKATYGGPIEWEGLPLYTDLCTGSIPALVHHNSADMSSREPLWERNWWNGTARQLLHFRQEQAREMGTLELTGGARTDTGLDLTWEELCPASMESKLFGDL